MLMAGMVLGGCGQQAGISGQVGQENQASGQEAQESSAAADQAAPQQAESGDTSASAEEMTDLVNEEEGDKNQGKNKGAAADQDEAQSPEEASIIVEKVDKLPEDFYFGVDISSYLAEKESGVVYKDQEGNPLDDAGFMALLKNGGVNLVRLRLWNDPTDEEGHTYGGGHCDLETVQTIGKLASDAGMEVLIDFHYSDFWADPRKQQAPKAWKSLSYEKRIDALHDFTKESLEQLIDNGVNVTMVQIGNETTTGMMGEKSFSRVAKYMNAGSQATREVSKEKNRNIQVALHFCNVEQGKYHSYAEAMEEYNVDYDIFGSSYYPYWHGNTQHLTAELTNIARDFGKKVMVMETSYSRTFEDGDGSGNTESESKIGVDEFAYDISLQGQADAVRAVVNAVVQVGKSTRNEETRAAGIGVCYWEPAWIPVNVWTEGAKDADEILQKNQEIWENTGSGWATSYSGAYDEDAAKYYGGSAVDNEAWFDFDGTALDTVNIYRYCRIGATAKERMTSQWDTKPKAADLDEHKDSILPDGDFEGIKENGSSLWCVAEEPSGSASVQNDKSNNRSGDYTMHYWNEKDFTFDAFQPIVLDAGTYTFGGYVEGETLGSGMVSFYVKEGTQTEAEGIHAQDQSILSEETAKLSGWKQWQNPECTFEIKEDGTEVTLGMHVEAGAGSWGSFDDLYLEKKK